MTFDDVLEIKNGRNQKSVENPDGKYPIYGSGGIMGYANDYICEADTVIIGRKGSINNPIFVEEPFWNVDTAFGLSAKRKVLLPKYLYYFCRHFNFETLNKAVTIPSLTKSDLLKIEIELPSMEIQQKVVDKLSKVEQIIQIRKQELQKLDDLVKARFVEMFGDPIIFEKDKHLVQLGEVCCLKAGKFVKADDIQLEAKEGLYPCFGGNGQRGYVSDYTHDGNFPIIGRQGALCGNVQYAQGKFHATEHAVVVTSRIEMDRYWLYHLLKLLNLNRYATGAAQPGLSVNNLEKIYVQLPELSEQILFSNFAKRSDKSKVAVQAALDEAQTLFDSLMQQYFG